MDTTDELESRGHLTFARFAVTGLVLAVVLVLLGLVPLSHPRIGHRIATLVDRSVPGTVTVGSASIALLRGARLRDVEYEVPLDDGRRLTVAASEISLDYRPLRLFEHRQDLAPRLRALFEAAGAAWRESPTAPLEALLASADAEYLLVLRNITVKGLGFSLRQAEIESAGGRAIDVTLSVGPDLPAALAGRMEAGWVSWGSWRLDQAAARFSAGEDRLRVRKFSAEIFGGDLDAKIEVGLRDNVVREGAIKVRKVDLERLYQSRPGRTGAIAGSATLTFRFAPCRLYPDSLRGGGEITCRKLVLDSIPLLNTIVIATAFPFLKRTEFDKIDGDYGLVPEGLGCDSLEGKGSPLDVSITGWLKPGGLFDFDVLGTFDRSYQDSMSSVVWNAMLPARDDGRSFLCRIYGTFDEPRVSVDRTVRRRAVRGVFQSIRGGIRNAFGRD